MDTLSDPLLFVHYFTQTKSATTSPYYKAKV